MKNKLLIVFFIIVLSACSKKADNPGNSKAFIRLFGGFTLNSASSMDIAKDGGFILIGTNANIDNKIKGQIYIVKTDARGIIDWEKKIGGVGNDYGKDIKVDNDGNFIVLSDLSNNTQINSSDSTDIYLLKIDSKDGKILWEKNLGIEDKITNGSSLSISSDGGFLLMGSIKYSETNSEMYLIKTDNSGNKLWEKKYGAKLLPNEARTVHETSDNDLIWCGADYRLKTGQAAGLSDSRVTKTNIDGDELFDLSFGGVYNDIANDIKVVSNGYVITGVGTLPNNSTNQPEATIYIASLFADGSERWKTYVKSGGDDSGESIFQDAYGNYVVTGSQKTAGNKKDVILEKFNSVGEKIWTTPRLFGGSGDDVGKIVKPTADGGFAILATVTYANIQVISIIKVDANGELNND